MRNVLLSTIFAGLVVLTTLSLKPPPPPPGAVGAYLNGIFSSTPPGGTWRLEEAWPGLAFPEPLRIEPLPNSSDLLVLCKTGEIFQVDPANNSRSRVLDIRDRSFKKGEAGTVGMALHPDFGDPTAPDRQHIFVFYRTKPNPDMFQEIGFNRVSKFSWDAAAQQFDPNSEEVLIQQYDRMTWHNGGGMLFGPDGFLYISVGDEGHHDFIGSSTQRLDGGLFSGVLRIDVDNDPTRSHPIIRQPLANADPPGGWGDTYSQGYSIPNDNPWLSPDGSQLEEFYALGLRSPYSMVYDSVDLRIWIADVGSDKREEINVISRGDNLQWPFVEGDLESEEFARPDSVIGTEQPVFFDYDGSVGSCIIGGAVYRGNRFPDLYGKYLCADWSSDKLLALSTTSASGEPELEVLLSDLTVPDIDLPDQASITGIFPQVDGSILITVMGSVHEEPTGIVLRLEQNVTVAEPPERLSELGVFTDLPTLTPAAGLIPYSVNSPLWSDRAVKQRWMAIPNDGSYDTDAERIRYNVYDEWTFPEGTVFVKHFELPVDTDPVVTVRLETRFFIIGEQGRAYGLTYKWNDAGTEAFLLRGGDTRTVDIYENGNWAFAQKWTFPSRDQCMTCHNSNARHVLGVKTHQLNGAQHYPSLGHAANQLTYLNEQGIFHRNIGAPGSLPRAVPIGDASADLEMRVRSYLDSNCASCHRPGGVNMADLDFRLSTPVRLQNIINHVPISQNSDPSRVLVEPGNHADSEIWVRDASLTDNRMPPLARDLIDEVYIDALAEWIDGLADDAGTYSSTFLFPNPTVNRLNIRIADEWDPPFKLVLYTIDGVQLRNEELTDRFAQFDLRALPAGTYVVELFGEGQREVKKFLLQ